MSSNHSWQQIQQLIIDRIQNQSWAAGELIPGEVALAEQFGCARSTVNRALRELAATGVIDRKRKAGTRVAAQRAQKVTASIAVVRAQVEQAGDDYSFKLLGLRQLLPPLKVCEQLELTGKRKAMHIRTLHQASGQAYLYEDRWINLQAVPAILKADLQSVSVNEWLVGNVPITSGELFLSAMAADRITASALDIERGAPVLCTQRTTWLAKKSVTWARLYHVPGHQIRFEI